MASPRCRLWPTGVLVFLLWGLIAALAARPKKPYFPPDVKICSAKDPNIKQCFTESANKMLRHLIPGIRHLNSVRLDPLVVPKFSLHEGNNILPTMAFNITDVTFRGWKDATVKSATANLKDLELNMAFYIPKYEMRGLYQINGSIVGIRMEGTGDFENILYNNTFDVLLRGHLEDRGGDAFYVIDNYRQNSTIDDMYVDFRNLFNDPSLSDATNKLLNAQSRAVVEAAVPVMDALHGELHAGLMQRILDRVPFRALFTDLD